MKRGLLNIGRDQGWLFIQWGVTKLTIKISFGDFLAQGSDQLAAKGVFDLYLRLDNTTPRYGRRAESGKSLCST